MKKGFTLIELLAVIVILAIIAVIATPIVLNIIKDAKKSATDRGVENYIHSLDLALANYQIEHELADGSYNIKDFNVDATGDIPSGGYIYVKDNKVINYSLKYKDKQVVKDNDKIYESTSKTNYPVLKSYETDYDELSTSDGFVISGATFSYETSSKLRIYVKKSLLSNYSNISLVVTDSTDTSNNMIVTEYEEIGDYIIFNYDGNGELGIGELGIGDFNDDIKISLKAIQNGAEVTSIPISYNYVTYASHIIYNTNNLKNKKILISLVNYITACQIVFTSNTSNLAYNILSEKDKNLTAKTSKSNNLIVQYSDLTLNPSIINNQNDELLYNDLRKSYTLNSLQVLKLFFSTTSGEILSKDKVLETEIQKYGIVFFQKKEVLEEVHDYSNLTKDINGSIILNNTKYLSNNAYEAILFNNLDFAKNYYYKIYYTRTNEDYIYSKLYKYNVINYYDKMIDKYQGNTKLYIFATALNYYSEILN